MDQSPPLPACPAPKVCSNISLRTAILLVMLGTLVGSGSVFYWYDYYAGRSLRILESHLYEVKGQRDMLIDHRARLKEELDEYSSKYGPLEGGASE
jgi:hypothetical protein